MPAARAASATAFCTTDSCRWNRDGGPHCGPRQIRAAGNTNCHFHSVDAVIVQRFFELVLRVDRVERRDDRAELPRAEFRDEELGAVRQEQADAVAAPDAERRERGGAGGAQTREPAVCRRRAFEHQRRLVGLAVRRVREVIEQRASGVRPGRRGDAGIVVSEPGRRSGHQAARFILNVTSKNRRATSRLSGRVPGPWIW